MTKESQDEQTAQTALPMINLSQMPLYEIGENWVHWNERLEMHMEHIGITKDTSKVSSLLKSLSSESYGVIHSICNPDAPSKKTYKELCDLLKQQFTTPVIIYQQRKAFYTAHMAPNETVSCWYARIKKLSIDCTFGAHLDEIVKDKFIIELPPKIFEKLCEETESLTLVEAYKKALIRETKIAQQSNNEVMYIKPRGKQHNNKKKGQRSNNNDSSNNNSNKSNGNSSAKPHGPSESTKCSHCGWKNHLSSSCKFKNSKCHSCGLTGHLKYICQKSSNISCYIANDENDRNFTDSFFNSIYSIETLCNVNSNSLKQDRYKLSVEINGHVNEVECDTGAPCSLMGIDKFDQIFDRSALRPCHTPYSGYTGDGLNLIGEFTTSVSYKGQVITGTIVVTNYNRPTLLGRDFLRKFGFELVQTDKFGNMIGQIDVSGTYSECIEIIKKQFSDVFKNELGRYNVSKVKLQVIDDTKPIFCKARSIPFAFKKEVEKQLDILIKMGTLTPTTDSEFATPIVPVPKPDGSFRICGDFKVTLNKYLVDFKYPLPNIEEIFASMQGGQLFTKLDLSNAYNQLELDDYSSKLCTLNTHKGLFRMTRLPFGIKTAAAIFQKTIDNLLNEFSGVFCYQDDIVITGANFAEHLKTLKQVLQKLQDVGLRLNAKKCKFFEQKISYLGFDIDKNGLTKNQDRIKSVINSPTPSNVSELRAFNGMVNYHSKFISKFAEKMAPLYELLRKGVKFEWNDRCQIAFETLKTEICSDKVLAHFNPRQKILLATDACNTAIAGVLFHRYDDGTQKPVAYVSRALNSAEKNYSTFEKEALAIIFSVIKLRQYLLGNKFILQTDHKPLITIFGEHKGIPVMAAARIQRWALILSGFNYSIEYIKGVLNTADSLSRIAQFETTEPIPESTYINYVGFVNVPLIDFKSIATHTRRDSILSKLMDSIHNGTVDKLEGDSFASFRSKSNELSVENGCILWGYRTVIPQKLQKDVLQALHMSHMGIVKTKNLARSYVYWPHIDKDIEIVIKSCDACKRAQASPEKSALIPWEPTDFAWQRIHIDFAGPVHGFQLFIIIDSFSKWLEVFKTKSTKTDFVVDKLREVMSRFGIVDTIVSDNGSQFTSHEFKEFIENNGIHHILTAPGHPATNGQAENSVKTVKKSLSIIFQKHGSKNMDSIINKFLFDYRITKHCTTNETPMKLMLGREVKSRFSLMKPPIAKSTIREKQKIMIQNSRGKRNKQFTEGQKVYVRNYKDPNKDNWSQATIQRKIGPRNYTCLLTHENRNIKRHLDQIIPAQSEEANDMDVSNSFDEGEDNRSINVNQVSIDSQIFASPVADADNFNSENVIDISSSLDDSINVSVPDVCERPDSRSCAAIAKDKIAEMFKRNR